MFLTPTTTTAPATSDFIKSYEWLENYEGPLDSDGLPDYSATSYKDMGEDRIVYALKNKTGIAGYSAGAQVGKCRAYGTVGVKSETPVAFTSAGSLITNRYTRSPSTCIVPVISSTSYYKPSDRGNDNACSKVRCMYDSSEFADDPDAVIQWVRRNGYDPELMTDFCSQPATGTACPLLSSSYVNTNGEAVCSRFVANNKAGRICRTWMNQGDPTDTTSGQYRSEVIMDEWAQEHTDPDNVMDATKTDPTCRCINRENDPAFSELVGNAGTDVNPGCWYAPCADTVGETYLVPTSIRVKPEGTCPSNICESFETVDAPSVSSTTVDSVLLCPNWQGTTSDGTTSGGDSDSDNDNSTDDNSDNGWSLPISSDKTKEIIAFISIGGAALVLTSLVLISTSKKK